MDSIDESLRTLVKRGFRFRHLIDDQGELVAIVGTYRWWQFSDRLHLHDERSAIAVREVNSLPGAVVWSYESDALSTMAALLELPGPHDPRAPRRVKPVPPGLWLPDPGEHR